MRNQSIGRVEDVNQAPVPLPWECAWCCAERGEKPKEGHTHGICLRHYLEVMRQNRKDHEQRAWQARLVH